MALIDEPDLPMANILKYIKGPDFPTGGQLVTNKRELTEVYEAGQGSLKLRGEWKTEKESGRGNPKIVITSIPYCVVRSDAGREDRRGRSSRSACRTCSTSATRPPTTCRVVLEYKKDADPQLVMAYLYKHTPLQTNVKST